QEGNPGLPGRTAAPLGDIEEADDVLVIEPRDRPGLLEQARVRRVLAQQELERHFALQLAIPGAEDPTHRARTQRLENLEPVPLPAAHPLPEGGHPGRLLVLSHLAQEGVLEVLWLLGDGATRREQGLLRLLLVAPSVHGSALLILKPSSMWVA